ncbi:MAG: hypothetical protein ACO3LZ_01120 [Candidatus Nanopelagicales bacterium]
MRPGRVLGAGVLGIALATSLLTPVGATQGQLTWQPSTWTGPVAGAPVPGEGLPPAPMPAPLPPLPVDLAVAIQYEPQTTCESTPKPGALRLEQIIKSTYGSNQYTWIPRDCDRGGRSEHKEGRAVDWMVDVRDPGQRANAEAFLNWLLGPDANGRPYGHALQLGIMYIGWHDRFWRGYAMDRGWTELKGCFGKPEEKNDNYCHRNHIHISLTWAGARGEVPGAPAVPIPTEPTPEQPPVEEPPAPPEAVEEGFYGIGAELGYESAALGPLQPGEVRTVALNGVNPQASSALVAITTREAEARGRLRIGVGTDKTNSAGVKVPKRGARTTMRVVPVSSGAVQIKAPNKTAVQVRVDVLGYSVGAESAPAVGLPPTGLHKGRFDAGEVKVVKVRGVGRVPKKKRNVTAVILRVTTKGRGEAGRFAAYAVGGVDRGATSAGIPIEGKSSTLLVAEIGDEGLIALASSTKTRANVKIVGYVG